jgi:hypothetical protein
VIRRRIILVSRALVAALGASALLAACASQPDPASYGAPGFFMALAHGFLAPFALIGGIFMDVRVYAFPNSGWWYDLGFLLGLGVWGGGATAAAQ